jgi:O-antigen/teichoic acid export membrane protein
VKLSPTLRRTLILFVGLGLSVPTGVVLASQLSRRLGPEMYGVVNVTISIIFWLELSSLQLFGRTTVRFVSASDNWQAIGSTLLRIQIIVSLVALAIAVLTAPILASTFNAPLLIATIPILALDIPLNGLAQTQGAILIGRGRAWQRSTLFAIRWIGRLIFIIVLLMLGFSVFAPMLGYVGASMVEVFVAAWFLRLPLTLRAKVNLRQILLFALPIGLYTISLELFNNLDLLMVRSILPGASAGYYSAAQYLTVISDLITASLSPVLISAIAPQIAQGHSEAAARMVKDAFRLVFGLTPFIALAAGASAPLLSLIYEPEFRAAAPAMTILLFSGIGTMLIVVGTAILVAYDLPGWTAVFVMLLIPLAIVGHPAVISNAGMSGAAWVTAALSWVCGLTVMLAACRRAGTTIPVKSLLLALVLGLICYFISALWQVEGWSVLLKLALLSLLPLLGYGWVGELNVRSYLEVYLQRYSTK